MVLATEIEYMVVGVVIGSVRSDGTVYRLGSLDRQEVAYTMFPVVFFTKRE